MITFEWDETKNKVNLKKHKISFEQAKSVFTDPYGRLIPDPDHSGKEERYILLGLSDELRMLVVCHCYRKSSSVIRIISARKAERHEKAEYERWLK
jgi:uncharacterized DUF497 family protein